MWKTPFAVLIPVLLLTGCVGINEPPEPTIGTIFGLDGADWANHFEKDENNQTEAHLKQLSIEFDSKSLINKTIVEYWLDPGDGSETIRIDATQGNVINYTYTGYGAFMARFGAVDDAGNTDTMPRSVYDWPALLRHGEYFLNETFVDQPSNLYIDSPNPNSVGSPERISIESRIANLWGWPIISESVDITWLLIGPDGEEVASHTETIQGGNDFTWEFNLENPERGSWELIIDSSVDSSLNQETFFRLGYGGFMYDTSEL